MNNEIILITGSLGQIGSEIKEKLRLIYGIDNVIATDIREPDNKTGVFEKLDVLDKDKIEALVEKYKVTTVYHLAALLSGTSEQNPFYAWQLNTNSLLFFLDLAKEKKIKKLFWPSSIAVFGNEAPKKETPQNTIQTPTSVYGISKMAGEQWCQYYFDKYNVDVRSVRYPGLISWKAKAGGGTTDYAVEIFHDALKKKEYTCFLDENTYLPMMYMEDAIDSTIKLMNTPKENISIRTSYNLGGVSFSPKEIAKEIKKIIPDFKIKYKTDFRQKIANSWPHSLDDHFAKLDFKVDYKFDLPKMVKTMINNLK